eukprot:GHVU01051593.1.p1 GENE.GHVU01051593.1~~GHVU01051593.1.p1  ORF type:complete len:220 (-),score=13.77 GHVU01051593.1:580-1203(-)
MINPSPSSPESSHQTPTKWRPSVLGYFSSSATSQVSFMPSETLYSPSRPSVSSNTTTTTATTTSTAATAIDNEAPVMLSNGVAFRSRQRSSRVASANFAENSVPPSSYASHKHPSLRLPLGPKSTYRNVYLLYDDDDDDESPAPTVAKPNAKPEVAFSSVGKSNTLSKMTFAALTKNNKKKRLIISGIAPNDVRKFEGVKHWCEGFG